MSHSHTRKEIILIFPLLQTQEPQERTEDKKKKKQFLGSLRSLLVQYFTKFSYSLSARVQKKILSRYELDSLHKNYFIYTHAFIVHLYPANSAPQMHRLYAIST